MTKAIMSYPEEQRPAVIKRRLAGRERGSGYYSARNAAILLGIPVPPEKKFGGGSRPPISKEEREKREVRRRRPIASIKNHMRVKS